MHKRRRMELMMTTLAMGVILVTALVSYWVLTGKTNDIQRDRLLTHGAAISRLLAKELDGLKQMNRDYAQWDDTLDYHRNGNEKYAKESFQPDVFDNLGISHMLFFDTLGEVRSGYSSIRAPGSVVPVSKEDAKAFTSRYGGLIRSAQGSEKDISGIVLLEGRPCLISIIRISDNAGEIADGSMGMAIPLGDRDIELYQDVLECKIAFGPPSQEGRYTPIASDKIFHGAMGDFITDKDVAFARLNLTDILWEPVLAIEISDAGKMWELSQGILRIIVLITIVSVIAITLLQSWLNDTFVLKPIQIMGAWLNDVTDYERLRQYARVPENILLREDASAVGRIHGILRRISEDTILLHRERLRTRLALDASLAGTWEYDRNKHLIHGDMRFMTLLDQDWDPEGIPRDTFLVAVNPIQQEPLVRIFGEYSQDAGSGLEMEIQVRNRVGEYRWFLIKGDGLEWDIHGKCTLFSGMLLDISPRKKLEAELVYLSYHDKLTGLFNRRHFEENLVRFDVPENLPIAIFVADINGLKLANDAFGHERGDKLLKQAAACLADTFGDEAIISRWGGDEYAILMARTDDAQAAQLLHRIKAECQGKGTQGMSLHLAVGYAVKTAGQLSLQHVVRSAEERMYRDKLLENRHAHADFLDKFRTLLHEKGIETFDHCQRVALLGVAMGNRLGLGDTVQDEIHALGALHDIGKITMPEDLFLKKEGLTDLEWAVVRSHPETGFRILALMQDHAHLSQAVLSHHERYDGSGYPRKLKGQDIPLTARIVTVADAVDVMLSGKPYKARMSLSSVIEELRRMKGIQFDPELADLMIDLLERDPDVSGLYPD